MRGLMTTQPSQGPDVSSPVSVIGPEFISPCAQEIIVDTYTLGTLVITDANNKTMIKVKPCSTSFHRQRVLLDPNDKPIVTLREKKMTVHDRWNVFRGDSYADSDLIFSIKTEHMIHIRTSVKVLLANSNDEFDFIFKGNWSNKKCAIYIGDTSRTIANTKPSENRKYCKEKFMVTINPNVDYAFVVAIIAVVDAMKNPEETVAAKRAGVVVNVIGGFSGLSVN